MAKLGMVIDLARCVGCGACAFACKAENNTRNRAGGQSYNWADFLMKTEGTFPNVTHWVMPVLCNHCTEAPCVAACPVTPKAMYKTPEGITMHDDELCIGCRKCQSACPYSHRTLGDESLNGESVQRDQLQSPRRRHAAAVDRQDRAHTRMYGVRRRNRAAGGRHDPDVEQVEGGRRRSGAPGRRGREVHILLPPHQPRACSPRAWRSARRRRASSATRTIRIPRSRRC